MKMYLYEASNDADIRAKSHKHVGGKLHELPPGQYVIKITKNRNTRSIPQNSFFHVVCQLYAIHTGMDVEEIKIEWKKECHFEWKYNKATGEEFKHLLSINHGDPDTKEFSNRITSLLNWGHKHYPEVIVPREGDLEYIEYMKISNEYNEHFNSFEAID